MSPREMNDYRRWYENWRREHWNDKFRKIRKTRRAQLNKNKEG